MKKETRRGFLSLAAGALALPALRRSALAQSYPNRQLRWVVGFPAGGGADIVSRIMGAWLAERLGQSVVVENRPGAASSLSVQQVANTPPDGYTLVLLASSATINASLLESMPLNLTRDIAPISGLVDLPLVLVTHPSVPAKTIPELIALAKSESGKMTLASYGTGSTSHVAGELFKMMTGISMVHVPYRGGAPMMIDLVAGQIQCGIDVLTGALPHIRSGAARALGMCAARTSLLPDVPSIGETVDGYEASAWIGLGTVSGTPADILERLNREINAGLADPAIKTRLIDIAAIPLTMSVRQFTDYVGTEVEKWRKVVKHAGIKAS